MTPLRLLFAALLVVLFAPPPAGAQTDRPRRPLKATAEIRLFAAPDDSSPPMESVKPDDALLPMAETIGSQGSKWYLVKTQRGVHGWIKAGDSDEAKRIEGFFKSSPGGFAQNFPIEMPHGSTDSAAGGAILVPIRMTGAAAFVAVTLNHDVQATMLLDTGASYTVVSRQLAARLRLYEASRATVSTANGIINVPLARLESLKVGRAEALNLTVAIQDVSAHTNLGGLLGLDFLGRFHTSIDTRRQLLVLAPR